MVSTNKFLEQYRIYKNYIEEKDRYDDSDYENDDSEEKERQEEIEEVIDEYWVDEDEAEEILDSM